MADRMTNVEIQDVLSSIRRLVSEDNRRRAVREVPAGEAPPLHGDVPGEDAGEETAAEGKLVLTPALRVAADEDEVPDAPAAEAPTPETPPAEAAEDAQEVTAQALPASDALEETLAELEAAVAGADDDQEDAAEGALESGPEPTADDEHSEEAGHSEDDGAADSVAGTHAADAGEELPEAEIASEAAEAAEELEAIDAPEETASGDDPLDTDEAPPFVHTGAWMQRQVSDALESHALASVETAASDPAMDGRDQQWASDASDDAPVDLLADPPVIVPGIDRAALQDLVSELIRQELQGPLGERITRNVRMLVRREINRALESRGND